MKVPKRNAAQIGQLANVAFRARTHGAAHLPPGSRKLLCRYRSRCFQSRKCSQFKLHALHLCSAAKVLQLTVPWGLCEADRHLCGWAPRPVHARTSDRYGAAASGRRDKGERCALKSSSHVGDRSQSHDRDTERCAPHCIVVLANFLRLGDHRSLHITHQRSGPQTSRPNNSAAPAGHDTSQVNVWVLSPAQMSSWSCCVSPPPGLCLQSVRWAFHMDATAKVARHCRLLRVAVASA